MRDANSPRIPFHVDRAPEGVFPIPLPPIADPPPQPGPFVSKADWPVGIPYGYQPTARTFDSAFKAAMDNPDVAKLLRQKRYAAVAAELLNVPCTDPCATPVVKLIIY